jgi:dolichyl-phosphate-mannose--protein O-mannosyl transferase
LRSFLEEKASWITKYVLVYLGFALVLLTFMDRFWTSFTNPFQHLAMMLGIELNPPIPVNLQIASYPWQWLLDQVQINYFSLSGGGQMIRFWGVINPVILVLFIPSTVYALARVVRGMNRLCLFAVCWTITTYFSNYLLVVLHRVTFLFYFLPTIPSACMAIGAMFFDQGIPSRLRTVLGAAYCILVLVGFFYYFPFR